MPLTPHETDMIISLTLGPNSCLVCRKLFFQAADLMKAIAKGPGDSWPQPEEITILHGELCWKRNLRCPIAWWWASSAAPSHYCTSAVRDSEKPSQIRGQPGIWLRIFWRLWGLCCLSPGRQRAPDGTLGSARLFSSFYNVHCYMKGGRVGV